MRKKVIRQISLWLALSLALTILWPVAAYAFTSKAISIWYRPLTDPNRPGLSAFIYTTDPDSVMVKIPNPDNTVTAVTYDLVVDHKYYDDDNNPLYNVQFFEETMSEMPSRLLLEYEGKSYELTPVEYMNGIYYYNAPETVNLGYYRMPGELLMPTGPAETYLPAGSDIATFKPSKISKNVDTIKIMFPYATNVRAQVETDNVTPEDFEVLDLTVSSAVYVSNVSTSASTVELWLDESLVQGHEYKVKFSASSSGNEVKLPPAGTYLVSVEIGQRNFYLDKDQINGVYFRNVTIGTPSGSSGGGSGDGGSGGGSGGGGSGGGPAGSEAPDLEVVNEESLRSSAGHEKVAVTIAGGKKQVLLPAHAAAIVGEKRLELKGDRVTVEIPPGLLKKLQDLVPQGQLADARILLSVEPLNETAARTLMETAQGKAKAKLKTAGEIYTFKLTVTFADGRAQEISRLTEPITLRLKIQGNANPALLGIYYIAENGTLEYVGGKIENGEIVAQVSHFSKYAALEYDKEFEDVPASFWAHGVIKELAAKHIISGRAENVFDPQAHMTRAEFAALIARALKLKPRGAPAFKDVAPDSVFADVIAAAHEAGIISGRSADAFAPNDRITREEMAVMIVRAYEYKRGIGAYGHPESGFADRMAAGAWARAYIDAAAGLGLVTGHGDGTFAPKGLMTRAEGAQIVWQLYNKI